MSKTLTQEDVGKIISVTMAACSDVKLTPEQRTKKIQSDLSHLMKEHDPMPGWKKKTYLIGASLIVIWFLVKYTHYEACREKYPQASGWVCMVNPN